MLLLFASAFIDVPIPPVFAGFLRSVSQFPCVNPCKRFLQKSE